ncbi:MAG: hypothetical protein ABMA14_18430 [Hyphomonadaceae bacterium]
MRNQMWRMSLWGVIAVLLVTPMVAMQFTRQVNWDVADFAVAAALLIGGGLLFELIVWRTSSFKLRAVLASCFLLVIALVWAEGAVGILN